VVLDTPSPLIVGPSEVLIDRCQRSKIPLFESELSCSPTYMQHGDTDRDISTCRCCARWQLLT